MSESGQGRANGESVPKESPFLSVENLTIERGRRFEEEEVCLRQVSLELRKGDFYVLAGEQGSGVSMFCRWVAAGMVRGAKVLSGEIILDGEPLLSLGRRRRQFCGRRILYAGRHSLATFEEKRTVLQNLRDFVRSRRLPAQSLAPDSLHEKLYQIGCMEPESLLVTPVEDLVRIDVARLLLLQVLLAEVDLLVCDWTTLDFDLVTERQFLEMLVHFQKEEKLSVLYTSGRLRGVEKFADRVAVFFEGGILEKGDSSDLISNPKFQYTREFLQCSPTLLDLPKKLAGISRDAITEAEEAVRGSVASLET